MCLAVALILLQRFRFLFPQLQQLLKVSGVFGIASNGVSLVFC